MSRELQGLLAVPDDWMETRHARAQRRRLATVSRAVELGPDGLLARGGATLAARMEGDWTTMVVQDDLHQSQEAKMLRAGIMFEEPFVSIEAELFGAVALHLLADDLLSVSRSLLYPSPRGDVPLQHVVLWGKRYEPVIKCETELQLDPAV
jgi:hypothetical protein